MLSQIPQEYHLFVAIGGMVLLLLFAASVAHKHQVYQAHKREALRRLESAANRIEAALDQVKGCPIGPEVAELFAKELLARYLAMRRIHARYPNVDRNISTAQTRVQSARQVPRGKPNPKDGAEMDRYRAGLTSLIGLLLADRLGGLPLEQRQAKATELGTLRAQAIHGYLSHAALDMAKNGNWHGAMQMVGEAVGFLQEAGPDTPDVRLAYNGLKQLYDRIRRRDFTDQPAQPAGMPGAA